MSINGQKQCTKCDQIKNLADFYQHKSGRRAGRYASRCNTCMAEYKSSYRKANPEKYRATLKAWREANLQKISGKNRVRCRTWYEANREKELANKKALYEANSERARARQNAWREANPEKARAQNKAWREANVEKHRANAKAWREANLERARARQKAWRETNSDIARARNKAWREANPDKARAREKAWRKANPEKVQIQRINATRKRRARKRQVPHIPITSAMKAAMYEAQSGRCYYGGELLNGIYDLEHKIPVCRGGSDTPDNIVLACDRCNSRKHRMTDIEFFAKLKMEAIDQQSEVPEPQAVTAA